MEMSQHGELSSLPRPATPASLTHWKVWKVNCLLLYLVLRVILKLADHSVLHLSYCYSEDLMMAFLFMDPNSMHTTVLLLLLLSGIIFATPIEKNFAVIKNRAPFPPGLNFPIIKELSKDSQVINTSLNDNDAPKTACYYDQESKKWICNNAWPTIKPVIT